MRGFCDIYLGDFGHTVPPEGRPLLDRICEGGERMSQLIEDLLRFARFSRQPLSQQPVSLGNIVSRVVEDLRAKEPGRSVDIRIGELPECYGDAALLEQVMVNLLANAFKFTRGREPAIIEVGSQKPDTGIVYFVRDNGAGFDMKYADKLFGVFQRLHTAAQFEGTGVGLSIVQRIIQRHGGRIWAEGVPGQGAAFYFTLAAS